MKGFYEKCKKKERKIDIIKVFKPIMVNNIRNNNNINIIYFMTTFKANKNQNADI